MYKNFVNEYEGFVKKLNLTLKNYVNMSDFPSLYKPIQYILSSEGKRLRPFLFYLSSKVYNVPNDKIFQLGLSVEMLHCFSLVHDDIMDEDDLRRGKETIHKKWDLSTAMLVGDAIFALVYKNINELNNTKKVLHAFTKETINLCEGQSLDKTFESKNSISIDDYLNMIELKTGSLLSLSCKLGGILGDITEDEINKLGNFGNFIGKAFQIQDDILEIYSDSLIMGKSLGSDIIFSKKTFLTCLANELNSKKWNLLNNQIYDKDLNNYTLPKLREFFDKHGIKTIAENKIKDFLDQGLSCIDFLPKDKQLFFSNYIKMILERKN